MAGVPTRSMNEMLPNAPKASRSEISRLWVKQGAEFLAELRARDLSPNQYVACFIDGIALGKDLVAVVALGVTCDGHKQVLDFEPGSSETGTVCNALLTRLKERSGIYRSSVIHYRRQQRLEKRYKNGLS
jgi:transposase-like protein